MFDSLTAQWPIMKPAESKYNRRQMETKKPQHYEQQKS
jgi:hypothetical protein